MICFYIYFVFAILFKKTHRNDHGALWLKTCVSCHVTLEARHGLMCSFCNTIFDLIYLFNALFVSFWYITLFKLFIIIDSLSNSKNTYVYVYNIIYDIDICHPKSRLKKRNDLVVAFKTWGLALPSRHVARYLEP